MTHETFSVGEIAIFWKPGHDGHGTELTVVSPLERGMVNDHGGVIECDFYRIQCPRCPDKTSGCGVAEPQELRKRRPPPQQLAKWENVPFGDQITGQVKS